MTYLINSWNRFSKSVNWTPDNNGCIMWTGGITSAKYGSIRFKGKRESAHRVSWFYEYGVMPKKGMVLHHTCEAKYDAGDDTYKRCVNPEHLEEVTQSKNLWYSHKNGRR